MLNRLPNDMLIQIFSLLPLSDKYSISLVNKNMHTIVDSEFAWRFACQQENITLIVNQSAKEAYVFAHGFIKTNDSTSYYIVGNLVQIYTEPTIKNPQLQKRDDISQQEIVDAFPESNEVSVFRKKEDALISAQKNTIKFYGTPTSCPVVFSVKINGNLIKKEHNKAIKVEGNVYHQCETHQVTFFSLARENLSQAESAQLADRPEIKFS